MDDIIFINKRQKIYSLIKKVSDYYGGDALDFLRSYAKEQVALYENDLQVALDCFLDLERQIDEKVNKMIL
jgi:hypothetical protein